MKNLSLSDLTKKIERLAKREKCCDECTWGVVQTIFPEKRDDICAVVFAGGNLGAQENPRYCLPQYTVYILLPDEKIVKVYDLNSVFNQIFIKLMDFAIKENGFFLKIEESPCSGYPWVKKEYKTINVTQKRVIKEEMETLVEISE